MSETTYYQLTKPGLDEPISPDPYNGNFDIIDKLLNAALEQVAMCRTVIGYDSKNLLKNTAISETVNGITFTVNDDGTVSASGTATEAAILTVGSEFKFEQGKSYIISGCPLGGGSEATYRVEAGNETDGYAIFDYGVGQECAFAENKIYNVRIFIAAGKTVTDLIFKPMIRYAVIHDSTYQKYVPSIEDRLSAIELRLSTTTEEV